MPECGTCSGYGMVPVVAPTYASTEECPDCEGTGTVEEEGEDA